MSINYQPIYIAGPTASGKSELALKLAEQFDSVIISADSMQIYRGLDIGTAKVSKEIRAKYEHKLIDIIDYDEEFSVAQFAELAKKEIDSAISQGKLPIIVGGTGLYFESLLYPMTFGKTIKNEELRSELAKEYEQFGARHMHDKLSELDSETAERLHPNDSRRIIRALEIILTTGKTLKQNSDNQPTPKAVMVALNTEREKLYDRINERVDKMFEEGLIQEALSVGSFDYQSMQAIGYKEFSDCKYTKQDGQYLISNDELNRIKSLIQQHTRNYAKRQITWFKKYDFIRWFECGDYQNAIAYIKEQLDVS